MNYMPACGDILHYRLSAGDIARRHFSGGNTHREGDTVPLLVVRVYPDEYLHTSSTWRPNIIDSAGKVWYIQHTAGVNGQVFLDGDDSLWVTSVGMGEGPGQWLHRPGVSAPRSTYQAGRATSAPPEAAGPADNTV